MATEKQTISEALGISEEWAVLNRYRTEKIYEKSDTISESIIECIQQVRVEEFGETTREISNYEKKLALTVFHLAQEIVHQRQNQMAEAINGIMISVSKSGNSHKSED